MSVDLPTDHPAECSLVSLAARNGLPGHQYMDAATISWIASHAHEFPQKSSTAECEIGPLAQRILKAAPIPPGWHAEPKLINSLHGTRHLLRTAALASLLAEMHGLSTDDTVSLVVAAAMHDCRRVHDNDDAGHGARASAWLGEHSTEVIEFFGLDPGADRVRRTAIAVRLHDIPYSAFTQADAADHTATEKVTDLLKTADALDRYRLPTRKWWPRYEYLRVTPPMWLRRTAFDLVVETENACLEGAESAAGVLDALSRRKLL